MWLELVAMNQDVEWTKKKRQRGAQEYMYKTFYCQGIFSAESFR